MQTRNTTAAPPSHASAARVLLAPSATDFTRLGGRALSQAEQDRLERMHQRAPLIVDRAHEAGVDIGYLGVAELFNETRVYRGVDNDWTLAPIDEDHATIVPREQQRLLRRLAEASAAPFLAYVAHEIDSEKSSELSA